MEEEKVKTSLSEIFGETMAQSILMNWLDWCQAHIGWQGISLPCFTAPKLNGKDSHVCLITQKEGTLAAIIGLYFQNEEGQSLDEFSKACVEAYSKEVGQQPISLS